MSPLPLVAAFLIPVAFMAHAADPHYPVERIQRIEIIDPSGRTAWEDKNVLDCSDVVLSEDDVRYALRHMRSTSRTAYFNENQERTGCVGSAHVVFMHDKHIVMGLEPTGRISLFESSSKLEPIAGKKEHFYTCEPCKQRTMARLKDALARASERRMTTLEAEGKIQPGEAQCRIQERKSSD